MYRDRVTYLLDLTANHSISGFGKKNMLIGDSVCILIPFFPQLSNTQCIYWIFAKIDI